MPFHRPHPLVALATVLLVALTIGLGLWQFGRGERKTELAARLAQQDRLPVTAWQGELGVDVWGRRYELEGTWLPTAQIYLDNRIHLGRPGYHVLSPLRLADGRVMVVNRGWLPRVQGTQPEAALPQAPARVVVRLQSPQQRYVTLSSAQVSGAVWQNLDWTRYRTLLGVSPVPALAFQLEGNDTLNRDWPAPDAGADKHYAYAGQWFLFAALAIVLFVFLHWKSRK
ncbi:SURF1 family protein [Chitinimonas sp. BJYL2]|uniref:SURF1 family protein n=1 Tax=Chitinimonas sp. BJYL2 TaxID=2976696 RepID=UPI0022B4BACE|nr:SURF1 family protein [Chitinimonas sp. BJYL2]